MKYDELVRVATETSRDVISQNSGAINDALKRMFTSEENNGKLSHQDALAKATALALTLVPEISAVVTAKLLVQLGLVKIEETE